MTTPPDDLAELRSIPHSAVCFFKDGNKWCCVNPGFVNLQESPAGFGDTLDEALDNFISALKAVCGNVSVTSQQK